MIFRFCSIAIYLLFLVFSTPAVAHEHHTEDDTVNYSGWVNLNGKGCCNNKDCRPIRDKSDIRYSPIVQVWVEGQWCEVKSFHYLKSGGSSNPNFSHVCVEEAYEDKESGSTKKGPCARLLCFQPAPLY